MSATDPARILRAIGSRNFKHTPPVSVTCARCELDMHELPALVGKLPDPPGEAPRRPKLVASVDSSASGSREALIRTVREAPRGERNALLFWAASTAQEERQNAREELRQAALAAGLDEREIERTLDSAEQRVAA
jgi:hypothetical protein